MKWSHYIENAIDQMASLPGIGRKTAERLVIHLIGLNQNQVELFSHAFLDMKKNLSHCEICNNVSEHQQCVICTDINRNKQIICVVRDLRDVGAIEKTGQFKGHYHVLGGLISPMDGIGPSDLSFNLLFERLKNIDGAELLFALPTSMEGETTAFYIYKKTRESNTQCNTLARGIAMGEELEYTDEITLGRSIKESIPFANTLEAKF